MTDHGANYRADFYITPQGECPTDEFLSGVDKKHRAKILKWLEYLEKEGPDLPRPYADIVRGKIRELRIGIAHHEYRFLYFFHYKIIIVTHGFLKKTDKVPMEEIERAERYMSDWLMRDGGNDL